MGKRNNRKRKLIFIFDLLFLNVFIVLFGVSLELEFNYFWNCYDKRNNFKKIVC